MFKKNIGKIDRIILGIVGIIFLVLGYIVHWGFFVAGVIILIVPVTIGFCGLYKIFGINRYRK